MSCSAALEWLHSQLSWMCQLCSMRPLCSRGLSTDSCHQSYSDCVVGPQARGPLGVSTLGSTSSQEASWQSRYAGHHSVTSMFSFDTRVPRAIAHAMAGVQHQSFC
jgi:hypothetical protein